MVKDNSARWKLVLFYLKVEIQDRYICYIYRSSVGFFSFFFYLGFTAHQDYFTHFDPNQSWGGAKPVDPRETTSDLTTPKQNLACLTLPDHSGEMTSDLER